MAFGFVHVGSSKIQSSFFLSQHPLGPQPFKTSFSVDRDAGVTVVSSSRQPWVLVVSGLFLNILTNLISSGGDSLIKVL